MVDNDRAQAILALQHAFIVNLSSIQDYQNIGDSSLGADNELIIAGALNAIENNINIIKDRIFNIDNLDINHIKNLYSTGLFPIETLAHMYSCPDNRIKEIVKDCEIIKNDIVDKANCNTVKHYKEAVTDIGIERMYERCQM